MNPRIAAIAGKLKGSVFPLGDEPVIIGRETAAEVCLADPSVSRRHSRIEKYGDKFRIHDLQSLNGTFVNDVPARHRALQPGDRIRLGDTQFLLLLHERDEPSEPSRDDLKGQEVLSGSPVQ